MSSIYKTTFYLFESFAEKITFPIVVKKYHYADLYVKQI